MKSWEREKRSPVKKEEFLKEMGRQEILIKKRSCRRKISKAAKDKCPRL